MIELPRFLERLERPRDDAEASRPVIPTDDDGSTRRVGVEIEFNGATIGDAVAVIAEALDGEPGEQTDYEWYVDSDALGRVTVELDHHSLKAHARERGPDQRRGVFETIFASAAAPFVPVEVVTEPLKPEAIVRLDDVAVALAQVGAFGTREGLLHAYGVHYNPQVVSTSVEDLHATLRAYAVLQDWLFTSLDVDVSRTSLPFVDAFDDSYVAELIDGPAPRTLEELVDRHLDANPTRNRALDVLPLFRHLAPEVVERHRDIDLARVKPRPTWHFRLTDSRVGESDWSVVRGWRHWLIVEDLAADPDRLDDMAAATQRSRSVPLGRKILSWTDEVTAWLK